MAKDKKNKVGFFADFKKFITKGNVLDMAVGVVVGTAFNAVVNGLVKNIITPFVTYFTSGISIDEWKYVLKNEVLDAEGAVKEAEIAINYGLWIQAIVDFIIIAFTIFVVVRVIKSAERKMNAKELAEAEQAAAEKKAADEAAAAEAAAIAAEKQAALDAREANFYANVEKQSKLLEDILNAVKK